MQTTYRFKSGAAIHVTRPSAGEECAHQEDLTEMEHLAGQVLALRRDRNVGIITDLHSAEMGMRLRRHPHIVANHNEAFYTLTALGYAALESGPVQQTIHISELATHHDLTTGWKRLPSKRWRGIQPNHLQVVGSLLWHVAQEYPEAEEFSITSREPSPTGQTTMETLGFPERTEDLYIADVAPVLQSIIDSGLIRNQVDFRAGR